MTFLMQFLAGKLFTLLATLGLCLAYALYKAIDSGYLLINLER